jgi:hypothetical protein
MHDTMAIIQASQIQIPPLTVVALIVVAALFVFGLLILLGMFIRSSDNPMAYGSFFVVALGITTVLIGFLVTFPLVISGVFEDPTQSLALMSALFGTVAGLVGTYFGVKSSSDARQGLQDQLVSSAPPPDDGGTPPPDDGGTPPPDDGGTPPPRSQQSGGRTSPPERGQQPSSGTPSGREQQSGGNPQPDKRG